MSRVIKFRAWDKLTNSFYDEGFSISMDGKCWYDEEENQHDIDEDFIIEQFTGLTDCNGVEIYESDIIRYKKPYRTTQTHTGDNIPNGSYTEPMEPGIKIIEGVVEFKDGMFILICEDSKEDFSTPLIWHYYNWDLESIKEAISWTRQDAGWFDDREEGDLQYLITECAKLETKEQLIEYLSGFEIIGNIHSNPDLL